MALTPIKHKKIIKKRIKKFVRFESEDFAGISSSWRRPRGIDNPVRRRFRGHRKMAKIGFGSDKKTRHITPTGFRKFLITNPRELDILLMNNKTYAAEFASNISAKTKAALVRRA
mmetsp:Transcript_12173/g.1839  ORF Transcript_12173/g.1839 Transcript_12173/m.1839 type:complete len:115 (+) Transcript_12173:75-419(+)